MAFALQNFCKSMNDEWKDLEGDEAQEEDENIPNEEPDPSGEREREKIMRRMRDMGYRAPANYKPLNR